MERDHTSKVDRLEKESKTSLDKLHATHDKQAESHENKFSSLMTRHHRDVENLKAQHETDLQVRTKPHTDRIAELNQRAEKASAGAVKKSSGPKMSSQDVAKASKELSNLQVRIHRRTGIQECFGYERCC
jgi:hypothetical protein